MSNAAHPWRKAVIPHQLRKNAREAKFRPLPVATMGLDVSLRGTGMVCLPAGWTGDWSQLKTRTFGYSVPKAAGDGARIARLEKILARTLEFVREHGVRTCWIEGYAYGSKTYAHSLGEVGGLIKVELVRAGIEVQVSNISQARKLALGKAPKVGAKEALFRFLSERLAPLGIDLDADQADALAALNFGLQVAGCAHFYSPPPKD